jgi:RNA polymerase sigma-70 factor (ECF subfamily)
MEREVSLLPEPVSGLAAAEPVTGAAVDVGALFRAHGRTTLRWAKRLGGPGIDAEDVVQEVFLVAKRRLRTFESPGQVSAWLFRTTEKVVLTARRKQRLRRWLSRSSDAAETTMGARQPTPNEALERSRDVEDVYRVLDRLPESQRRILVLFELEGLSTQEIGELIGTKVSTVRVRLFRARERFSKEHQRLFGPVQEVSP